MFDHTIAPTAYIHPSATVDSPCHVGEHTAVLAYTHLMSHVLIGDHTHLASHVTVHSGVMVGHQVKVMAHVDLVAGVIVEDEVYVGSHTTFAPKKRFKPQTAMVSQVSPTVLKQGCVIGPHSTLACGVNVGAYSQVQPYSLVETPVPAYALVGGNPARILGWRCACGHKLVVAVGVKQTECGHCGSRYRTHPEGLLERIPPSPPAYQARA